MFLNGAEDVFDSPSSTKSEEDLEKDRLLKTIGQLKVENDFNLALKTNNVPS